MTIRSEERERFIQLFEIHREAISSMPGCQSLQIFHDLDSTCVFFTVSNWQTDDHLQQYRNSMVFKSLWPEVKSLFQSSAEAWTVNEIPSPHSIINHQ